jgi:Zn-dependent protease with chaperone function
MSHIKKGDFVVAALLAAGAVLFMLVSVLSGVPG